MLHVAIKKPTTRYSLSLQFSSCHSLVGLHAVKLMLQTVFAGHVAGSAEVKVIALHTLPPQPGDILHSTGVTEDIAVPQTCSVWADRPWTTQNE